MGSIGDLLQHSHVVRCYIKCLCVPQLIYAGASGDHMTGIAGTGSIIAGGGDAQHCNFACFGIYHGRSRCLRKAHAGTAHRHIFAF